VDTISLCRCTLGEVFREASRELAPPRLHEYVLVGTPFDCFVGVPLRWEATVPFSAPLAIPISVSYFFRSSVLFPFPVFPPQACLVLLHLRYTNWASVVVRLFFLRCFHATSPAGQLRSSSQDIFPLLITLFRYPLWHFFSRFRRARWNGECFLRRKPRALLPTPFRDSIFFFLLFDEFLFQCHSGMAIPLGPLRALTAYDSYASCFSLTERCLGTRAQNAVMAPQARITAARAARNSVSSFPSHLILLLF